MASHTELVALHKALGDPTRLRMLSILDGHELRVSEIVEILDMGQSRISRHLRILADAEVITQRRSGVWTFCSIREDGPYRGLVEATLSLLEVSEQDAARTASVVAARRSETIEFFDTRAGQWETMKRRLFGSVDPDAIAVRLAAGCPSVADLGCGDGRLVEMLAAAGSRVIGVDNAPAMIRHARTRHRDRREAEFRLGDVEHLPLGDGEVSCAVLSLVLHHLAVPALAIGEAARVVEPGGSVLVIEFGPHGDEALRTAHGDRLLGVEQDRVIEWAERSDLTVAETATYTLGDGKELFSIVLKKLRNEIPSRR